MTRNLLFDFSVNKEKKTISVKREFDAELDIVWTAWTTPELLDLWWAPKPYQVKTKSLDFREGGFWFYAMIGPDNTAQWCRADYKKIELHKGFEWLDAFCDERGSVLEAFPRSYWSNSFNEDGNTTTVNITISFKELADLEKLVEMGFREGFTAGLSNLDQYIKAQQKLRSELRTNNKERVSTYLNFPGNTEEAFLFYKSVFKTEFSGTGIQRFGDLPADVSHPPVSESVKKMVLHIELPIINNHILMGTDAPEEMGFKVIQGNNMHISLEPETREETQRIFEALAAGGDITMPLQDMFWGAYYGSCKDKFGINWMVNYQNKK